METILITGANRGIGLHLCQQFLQAGWQVIATCRNPPAASALAALDCAQLRVLPLDVSDAESVRKLAAALHQDTLDVLVNNAGVMGGNRQSVSDMDYAAWLETLQVNTIAPLRVAAALLPLLKRSAHARIVTVSSQMGAFGLDMGPGHIAYSSSKAAVSKVMQLMAKELQADNIIVCPVHPGWVQTDMGGPNAAISPEQSAKGLYRLISDLQMQHSGRFWTWEGKEHAW